MTNQLIPVFKGTINNTETLLCDARKLHTFLQVGKRFADWIKARINEYEFIENKDYIAISQNREIGHGRGKIDYHLTLDTAKELAMVERNEQGKIIRRYFIECEKQLLASQQSKPKRRGPYKNKKSDLPSGVYHCQSKYNPYRATAHVDGKFVHVGSFPTVDDAVAAIEHFYKTGTVQRLHEIKTKPHINISNLIPKTTNNSLNQTDLINHLKVFLEAAQLLSGYQYGKDLAWDLIAFMQEEASRHC